MRIERTPNDGPMLTGAVIAAVVMTAAYLLAGKPWVETHCAPVVVNAVRMEVCCRLLAARVGDQPAEQPATQAQRDADGD